MRLEYKIVVITAVIGFATAAILGWVFPFGWEGMYKPFNAILFCFVIAVVCLMVKIGMNTNEVKEEPPRPTQSKDLVMPIAFIIVVLIAVVTWALAKHGYMP